MKLSDYQRRASTWVMETLGVRSACDRRERALRLLEEALELAQSLGVEEATAWRLVDYVYDRPVGEPSQELSGVAITLLAAATACDVQLEDVLKGELVRINSPEVRDQVREKQRLKFRAGVSDTSV